MLYEFKDGLNKYFRSLGEDTPVSDINDLIQQTLSDPVEMRYFDHDRLLTAQEKGPITEAAYEQALSELNRKTRTQGIDRVMNMHDLDVIISITGGPAWKIDLVNGDNFGLSSSSPAARSGYPNITVPMGRIEGLPVGMSFFCRAWDEAKLIGYAHAFEQMTQARFAPLSD